MDILIKTTEISPRTNKHQIGYSFRTYGKKGKKISPRMVWFHASGTVEILNVHWPFITWSSKEWQVHWWNKLQKLRALKRKTISKFFVGIKYKKKQFIIHPKYFDANNIFSHPFIQNLKHKPNMVQELSMQIKIVLKKILENSVKQKIHQIQRITGRNGKREYRGCIYAKN